MRPEIDTRGFNKADSAEILIPLPDHGFDPTECAIPWKICTSRGWQVVFSTEIGNVAHADPHMLRGPIFGPLGAGSRAIRAYRQMTQGDAYQHPVPYAEIDPEMHLAILLPGGHASGVRQYLESKTLQAKVLQFWQQGKLIGAICHGVLVLTRTIDPSTARSVLYGYKLTALPYSLDLIAQVSHRLMGRSAYSCNVAKEVLSCPRSPGDFSTGKSTLIPYAVCDRNLVTARYWHDAQTFGELFAEELGKTLATASTTHGVSG